MPDSPTLLSLLDDAAILSVEHQLRLADLLGDDVTWEFSLDEPRFQFTGGRAITCERVHLLGRAAAEPGTWQWVWAHPYADNRFPEQLTAAAKAVRDFGQRHGIAEFATPELPFAALPGSPSAPAAAAHVLAQAAKVVTGRWTSYVSSFDDSGARLAFLIEHPDMRLPAPNWADTKRAIQAALDGTAMTNQRQALTSYAELRRVGQWQSPDPARARLVGPDFEVVFHFNQDNRVTLVNAKPTFT